MGALGVYLVFDVSVWFVSLLYGWFRVLRFMGLILFVGFVFSIVS